MPTCPIAGACRLAPPDEIVAVDHEEGSNPDRKLSHGRPAPPFDAAERGGSPRPRPQPTSPVATTPATAKAKPVFPRARAWEQKAQKNGLGVAHFLAEPPRGHQSIRPKE
jgi:hypothetical protein